MACPGAARLRVHDEGLAGHHSPRHQPHLPAPATTVQRRERAEAGGFRLNETTRSAWQTTLDSARALGATAILFQCPPSFRATDDNVEAMREFLGAIERPPGVRLLWEPRGPWPGDLVLAVCRELGLLHAVDPFIRPSLTPELLYWRLHGNKSHYARYSDDELRQIIDWLPSDPSTDAYVLFNSIPRVHDVRRFRELLALGEG